MAFKGKNETKKVEKIVNQKHKIIVSKGGNLYGDYIPYKVIHTEFKANLQETKVRIEELKMEYPNNSIVHFSV